MIDIIRGNLNNKPESSKQLANLFQEEDFSDLNGSLYIGYPIIGTAKGGYQIDALLITKEKGIIAFHIEEGSTPEADYQFIQDENYTKLSSKLMQYNELTKKRKLGFDINVATYCPAWSNLPSNIDEDYPCFIDNYSLKKYLNEITFSNDDSYYEKISSVIQSVTTIRNPNNRTYIVKDDSKGARLKKIEDSIANLDRQQSAAVIETVDGVQRIRGLAGSGKTIILALKVAYLHSKNSSWNIAVTFNTRSLREQFKKLITMFTYEHINEEPNWDKLRIVHAWGSPRENGIYYELCKEHNIEYYDFNNAKKFSRVYGEEFDNICSLALSQIKNFKEKYDLIVVDEAQDFSKDFLKICYKILKTPHRLVYAYDELQNLSKKTIESPEILFGNDSDGNPLVELKNEVDKPKTDIILYKCYRNPLEILTSAHALGFGIYNKKGLIQMFSYSNLWEDIGYKVISGDLNDGSNVELARDNSSSPEFLSNHSTKEELIDFMNFSSNEEQVDYIVNSIKKNIEEDELKFDDIMVINPDPLTTKKVTGLFREKLFKLNINSNLVGVTTSPDIFYESDAITFTSIYRAKGNEAAMVYIINAQYCYSGLELAKKRNILFTAMTRSKAWLRVCGYGEAMNNLKEEFEEVKRHSYKLKFKYPTESEREKMNLLNRDMTNEEKNSIKKNEKNLSKLLEDLTKGTINPEDLPSDLIKKLKEFI